MCVYMPSAHQYQRMGAGGVRYDDTPPCILIGGGQWWAKWNVDMRKVVNHMA